MATVTKPRLESRLQPLSFEDLAPNGNYFLEWSNDAKTYLVAEEFDWAFNLETAAKLPFVLKWQDLLLLRWHLDTSLSQKYIHIEDPVEL